VVEDNNEIAIMGCLEADEEVQDEIENAKRVENDADANAPHFAAELSMKGVREWNVEEQQVDDDGHQRSPVKAAERERNFD
jgi:hypothetical protein